VYMKEVTAPRLPDPPLVESIKCSSATNEMSADLQLHFLLPLHLRHDMLVPDCLEAGSIQWVSGARVIAALLGIFSELSRLQGLETHDRVSPGSSAFKGKKVRGGCFFTRVGISDHGIISDRG
jgi:hypothetical protein